MIDVEEAKAATSDRKLKISHYRRHRGNIHPRKKLGPARFLL